MREQEKSRGIKHVFVFTLGMENSVKDYVAGITDDYLIGLSNKGTVKRGHKDYESLEEHLTFAEKDGMITVALPDAEVVLRNPISEASCTCPSKTLCKHIVMAVLAVQAGSGKAAADAIAVPEENAASRFFDAGISSSYPELCAFPFERLMRAWGKGSRLGTAEMEKAFSQADVTFQPSTIVVRAMGETVTLLEPFSTSKCSCHKSTLCSHKAFAALAVRYQDDRKQMQPLLQNYVDGQQRQKEKSAQDTQEKKNQIVKDVQAFLTDFMSVGLNRASESNVDELMRLSIMSHNAGMPNLEQKLRQLEQEWIHYHKGGGISKIPLFLARICGLYELTGKYLEKDESAVKALTGTFRAEYVQSGDCRLYGITSRLYEGKGGFAGTIYYFLDWEKERILTYQDIRPNLYEGRKKTVEAMGKEDAPWELGIRKEELAGKEILLKEAKISEEGKLSASKETKGELIGSVPLTREMMGSYYYEDFQALLSNYMEICEEDIRESRRLVFLKPERIEEPFYDEVAQQFTAAFIDRKECVVRLQIDYHKSREYLIRHLERLFRQMERGEKKELVFFGLVSLSEKGLCFYPYEYF